jgi:hypothetical protein
MTDYRACVIGPDGGTSLSRKFVGDNDEQAIRWAMQIQKNNPVELWSGERLVKRLDPLRSPSHNADSHEVHEGRMIPKPK